MLNLVFILFACVAAINAQPDFQCEVNTTAPNFCVERRYPHPEICCEYYQCDAWCTVYDFFCPLTPDNTPLHFNEVLQDCDWPVNANCAAPDKCDPTTTAVTTTTPTTTTTTPTTTVTPPVGSTVAFCVARTTSGSAGVVDYTDIMVNLGSAFNATSDHVTIPRSGLYWFHLTAGIPAQGRLEYRLRSPSLGVAIYRSSTAPNGPDTTSRDIIHSLTAGDILYVEATANTYSDVYRQTQWIGFNLNSLYQPLYAFSVARDYDFFDAGIIPFYVTFVNQGGAWNAATNEFVAPVSGTFLFSLTTAVSSLYSHSCRILVNGVRQLKLWRNHVSQTGTDALSRSAMFTLSQGDRVSVELEEGGAIYSDLYHQTSFSGFLYEPIGIPKIAWSAHRSTSGSVSSNPIEFDRVYVNIGGGFSNNHFRAPVTGYYYVQFNVGALPQTALNVNLMRSGMPYVNLLRSATYHGGADTLGRATIVQLSAGEIIQLETTTSFYSDSDLVTSFTGFLLVQS